MNENENKTRRTLSSRLRSLVPSSSKSPPQSEPMRQPRPQPLKPKPRLAPLQPPMPSPPSSSQPSPVKSPLPILRWLGHHPSSTSLHSNASTPSSASSRSASPLSSLQDALSSPLPPPPQVTPPSASHQRTDSHSHLHPAYPSRPASMFAPNSPPFLHTFTRSTLPSTTLATPFQSSLYAHDPFDLAHHRNIYTPTLNYPVNIEHSPPQRTSLDTLRSLQDRERERVIHTQQPPSRKGSQHAQSNSYSTAASSAAPSSGWWWFQGDNKEDVDRLLDESDRAETVSQEQLKIHKKYLAPKNPLVFCHGLLGFDSVTIGPSIAPLEVTHWRGIKEVLEANGAEVLITRVPATSSPVERAKVLEKKIEEVYPGRKVHLIGHSMGGLDCRYLTTNLHSHTFTVLSVTTVATPHRGSTFADHFLETVGRSRLPQVLSLLDMLPNGGGDGQAFESLTIESMRKFNEETPDVEGVRYFSWGAVYDPGLIDTWK
ncbi:alpha/beta-hydrolase [Dentipellis sp. KUC8613]|nr:alpha/beta-hydrolase [Dentipellis sp. KUC8613]